MNATLYASGGLTRMLAQVGQFPPFFGSSSRLGSGSAISLTIFLLVGIAGYRRRADTWSSAAIVLAAIALTATVLVFFAVDTLRNEPETFTAIVAILLMSVVLDLAWKRVRGEAVPQERG